MARLLLLILAGVFPLTATLPCARNEAVNVTDGIVFANGSLLYEDFEFLSGSWFEVFEDGVTLRFGCQCGGRGCFYKCCDSGEELAGRNCSVGAGVAVFSPPVYRVRDLIAVSASEHFHYLYDIPCSDRYLLDSNTRDVEMYLQENGTLYEIADGRQQWHVPGEFCMDTMQGYDGEPSRLVAVVCYPDLEADDSSILYTAYAIGMLLSVPFLLATFIVYAWIPELRNLHGLCLMAYCGGLIVAYVFLAYLKLRSGQVDVQMTGCLVIAFIIYYSFQSSFFWLNVMCFDIWRTFSGYRGSSSGKRRERRRFAMYGAYAWGAPLVLTAITAAMQFSVALPNHIIRPNFGDRRCWFEDWLSELVYFMTPVLALVVCNMVLFAVTANRIRSIRQETTILKSSESSRSDRLRRDKQRYTLYLKLFVVMGVNWSVELISFAVGGSNWYWVIIDLSNITLGLFIFIIFVWKNKARTLLLKRFRRVPGIRSTTDSGTGRWENRSSSAPTEDTRIISDDGAGGVRLKDMH